MSCEPGIVLDGEVRSLRLDRRLPLEDLRMGAQPALRRVILARVQEGARELDAKVCSLQICGTIWLGLRPAHLLCLIASSSNLERAVELFAAPAVSLLGGLGSFASYWRL